MKIIRIGILCFFTGMVLHSHAQKAHIIETYNHQPIFVSGMNLAWMDFANDLTSFNDALFSEALSEISQAGGNTMRWWLHINGNFSPIWVNDTVTGISEKTNINLKRALDLAQKNNIKLVLCLWSFDMLQGKTVLPFHERNKKLLEDTTMIKHYIDKALVPMVSYVKDHESILCWEIFNEPEGMTTEFGWTPTRTTMINVQRFINRCAGAIHRAAPNQKVSNGSWSFYASSDIWETSSTYKNYYSDKALIAAGGDTMGTLDFYMVHYYDWGGQIISPFHHPASYWKLDKPLVIAEFSAKGPYEGITPENAFSFLFQNGYAGALAWTWTGHDGNGGMKDAAPGIELLYRNYPEQIKIREE